VTIYGSARISEDHPDYRKAREVARQLAGHGYAIVDRRRPGIMEAATGASRDADGISIGGLEPLDLPHETGGETPLCRPLALETFQEYNLAWSALRGYNMVPVWTSYVVPSGPHL